MLIATWNVNSIQARLPNVLAWLDTIKPDVLLLQELKTVDENFPALEFSSRGYHVAVHGQKSWNGVAILSKMPMTDVTRGLAGDDTDVQARYIEATIGGVRIASLYLPNGNPVESEKFPYKLAWMDRLHRHAEGLLESGMPFILGGDFNIIPADEDCHDPAAWREDALFRLDSRRKFRALLNLGMTDAFRVRHPAEHAYTFWDYQGGAWQKDAGIRIDHFLLSPQAADKLQDCWVDKNPRSLDKASDHTPVLVRVQDYS